MIHYLYYDFEVAIPSSNKEDWKYQNIKVPATSPIAAVLLKLYALNFIQTKRVWKHSISTKDILYLAQMNIRRIHEYKLVRTNGKTVFHFKKMKEYRIDAKYLQIKECNK